MSNSFDNYDKSLGQLIICALLCLTLITQFAVPAHANDFRLGPIVNLSDPDAFAGCGSNGAEKECSIAVNPINPKNICVAWIGGGFVSIGAAVSVDGGKRWQQVVIPEVSLCAGGRFDLPADPWLSFAPNGDLYLSCVASPIGSSFNSAILVSKSTDGGLHWSSPAVLFQTTDKRNYPDKPSITADPTDSRFVYATWSNCANGNRGQAILSRTTDGGRTWEPARAIYDPGSADHQAFNNQVIVLRNGSLLDFFVEDKFVFDGSTSNDKEGLLSLIISLDRGQTWSRPVRITAAPLFGVTDPETGVAVQTSSRFASFGVALDPINGNLYAVWEDTRFSNGQYGSIAFAMSSDGGLTWSAPIQINKTPTNIPAANRQAFLPTISVAADGTIAVSYYDFRSNDPNPGLLTDYWLVHSHPSATAPATNPANWDSEVRLSAGSFDLEKAPLFPNGYFIGDYQGLATVGNEFLAACPSRTTQTKTASSSAVSVHESEPKSK